MGSPRNAPPLLADLPARIAQHNRAIRQLGRTTARFRRIAIITEGDACAVCAQPEGEYPASAVPSLPVEGCAHPDRCQCWYLAW